MIFRHNGHQRTGAVSALLFTGLVMGKPDSTAPAYSMNYSSLVTTGPDGPWNVLSQFFDYPGQLIPVHPSFTTQNLLISEDACKEANSNCVLPVPDDLYKFSAAQDTYHTNGPSFPASNGWDNMVSPLGLTGDGFLMQDRIELRTPNDAPWIYADFVNFLQAQSYTVNFPKVDYTLTTGLLSLAAEGNANVSWTSGGKPVKGWKMLPRLYENGAIPSMTYGLHIGSAEPNISGSLNLGGYDSSRCLEPPITTTGTPELLDISLEVASGESAYVDTNPQRLSGLLKGADKSTGSLRAMPNPGVPYLNLPQETCDAIAAQLPVKYDSDVNLYIWDTSTDTYDALISSPHYLNFTFASDSAPKSIAVPFALLNLTLEAPLVSQPTQYFPCSPYVPTDPSAFATDKSEKTFFLGRAFLQAAFIGHNWHSETFWLSQAPGPDLPSSNVRNLPKETTNLQAMSFAPKWQDTWSSVLKPLAARPADVGETTGQTSTTSKSSGGNGLSKGAAAGIGIAVGLLVIGLLALLAWWLMRRRRRSRVKPQELGNGQGVPPLCETAGVPHNELPSQGIAVEKEGREVPVELGAGRGQRHEPWSPADQKTWLSSVEPAEGSPKYGRAGFEGVSHELDAAAVSSKKN